MRTPKWLYDFIYRHEINAWDIGPRKELVDFIERPSPALPHDLPRQRHREERHIYGAARL